MPNERNDGMTNPIAWIALIVAGAALILAVTAYNRAGTDLSTVIEQEAEQAVEEIDTTAEELERNVNVAAARAEAVTRLTALRAQVAAEEAGEEAAQEVADIRADLEAAYTETSEQAQQEFSEIDADLEQLENQIRAGSVDALNTLDGLIDLLRQDTQEDVEGNPFD